MFEMCAPLEDFGPTCFKLINKNYWQFITEKSNINAYDNFHSYIGDLSESKIS